MQLYQRINQELEASKCNHIYNDIKNLSSPQAAYLEIDNKKYLNMCSNNYLGWANDEITIAAVKESAEKFGVGPGAVRSIAGSFSIHQQFEEELAKFKDVEAVLVVQSGFQANTSLLPTITTKEDIIISDKLNHASIIDAIKLSKATFAVYEHCDMNHLEKILQENQNIKGNIFIISDGVFSMDGDIAPFDKIVLLAKKYHAYTIVDDAHGEGVLGNYGKGVVDYFKLKDQVDIEIGTLSKAFGLVGGFIGGKKVLIDYLKQKARPFLFSSSLDMGMCCAGIAILKQMQKNDQRVKKLWENANYLQTKLVDNGYSIGNTMTPITPFMVYSEQIAIELTAKMFENKILVSPIVYPTVAKNQARIRIMVSALHQKEDLEKLYQIITIEYQKIKVTK